MTRRGTLPRGLRKRQDDDRQTQRGGTAIAMGMRYALTGGGSLAESYVLTGGYMRSDPSLAVSDTIVVMSPALVTRRGVRFRLRDLFPETPWLYRDGGFRPAAQPRTYPAA